MQSLLLATILFYWQFIASQWIIANPPLPPPTSSHYQRLQDLRDVIDIKIETELYFVQKVQGVKALHHLVFSSGVQQFFGLGQMIEKVVIFNQFALGNDGDNIHMPLGTTMMYQYDGQANAYITEQIPLFFQEFEAINRRKDTILAELPQMQFDRHVTGLPYSLPDNNHNYLNTLRAWDSFWQNSPLQPQIAAFDHIKLVDGYPLFSNQTLIQSWKVGNQSWLGIQMGRDWTRDTKDLLILHQLADIVIKKGFSKGVTYNSNFQIDQLGAAVTTLTEFLNEDKITFLQGQGVAGFSLTSDYRKNFALFYQGILSIGTTPQAIEQIIDLVFF